jgi:hypothetical protein
MMKTRSTRSVLERWLLHQRVLPYTTVHWQAFPCFAQHDPQSSRGPLHDFAQFAALLAPPWSETFQYLIAVGFLHDYAAIRGGI